MRVGAPLLLVLATLLLSPEPRYSGMLAAARRARKQRSNAPATALAQLSERVAELERGKHLIRPTVVAQLDVDMTTMRDVHRHVSFDALHGSFIVRWRHLLDQPNAQVRRGHEILASAMARAPEPSGLVALGAVQVMLNDFKGAVGSLSAACGVGKNVPTADVGRRHVANACVQLAMVLQQYRPHSDTAVPRLDDIIQHGLEVIGNSVTGSSDVCELRTLQVTLGVMSQNGDRVDKAAVKELASQDPLCVPAQLYQKMGYGLQRMELESTRRMSMLDKSNWELLFALFEGLHQAGLHDAADDALRAALRVHPALAQKLELQYLRSSPAQPLAHLRRAVEILRTVDDHQLMQVSAAEVFAPSGAADDGSVDMSTRAVAPSPSLPLPDSFCPGGRRRWNGTTPGQHEYGNSLRPPLADRQLGGECKRISTSDAAQHFQEHGWDNPVVVVPANPDRLYEPPAWTSPQELVKLAGNETFRISWLYSSGHLNEVQKTNQWREDPSVLSAAQTNSLDLDAARVLLRPPMAAVSMSALVRLMQKESTINETVGVGAADRGVTAPTDLSQHVLRSRMYLNQKAVPNFIEPLTDLVGEPPEFLKASSRRRSLSHFWMGNAEVTTGLHTDDFDNVIAVLRGRKSVLLFRPEERQNLYYEPAIDVCVDLMFRRILTSKIIPTCSIVARNDRRK